MKIHNMLKSNIYIRKIHKCFIGAIILLILLLFYFVVRIFICDQFIIPSNSMAPTFIPGDRVIINKLIFGARIYKSLDFNKEASLVSYRTWGWRKIKVGDILIFNYPHGYNYNKISFKINYVYAKRCIGIAGDTISIENGFFKNSRINGAIGILKEQLNLSFLADSLIANNVLYALPFDPINYGWTIKNFGPLYIPKNGETINLNIINYKLYEKVIEYETDQQLSVSQDSLFLNDRMITSYKFKNNYYFMCGDNVMNSGDSRYWGFVPEDFIIGVVSLITFSKDENSGEFRWDRLLKKVQ